MNYMKDMEVFTNQTVQRLKPIQKLRAAVRYCLAQHYPAGNYCFRVFHRVYSFLSHSIQPWQPRSFPHNFALFKQSKQTQPGKAVLLEFALKDLAISIGCTFSPGSWTFLSSFPSSSLRHDRDLNAALRRSIRHRHETYHCVQQAINPPRSGPTKGHRYRNLPGT